MANRIRVKDPISGHEYDVPESRLVVCPGLVVLDKPTGRTKPRLPLGTPLPGGRVDRKRQRAAEQPADTTETTAAASEPATDEDDGLAVNTEKEI